MLAGVCVLLWSDGRGGSETAGRWIGGEGQADRGTGLVLWIDMDGKAYKREAARLK